MGVAVSYAPTGIFHYLPFLSNVRNPSRAVYLVYLFVPIVVATFLNNIKFIKMLKWKNAIYLLIFFVSALEYWPQPYPIIKRSTGSKIYYNLKDGKKVKVIWEVPTGLQDGFIAAGKFDILNLQQQIEHNKNLLGGYISRLDSSYFQDFRKNSVFNFVNTPRSTATIPSAEQLTSFLSLYTPDVVVV